MLRNYLNTHFVIPFHFLNFQKIYNQQIIKTLQTFPAYINEPFDILSCEVISALVLNNCIIASVKGLLILVK